MNNQIKEKDINKIGMKLSEIINSFSLDTVNTYYLMLVMYTVSKNKIDYKENLNLTKIGHENYKSFLLYLKEEIKDKLVIESINTLLDNIFLFCDYQYIEEFLNTYNYKDIEFILKYIDLNKLNKITNETPQILTTLVNKIFDIKNNSSVLDLCCGNGEYLTNTIYNNETSQTTGFDMDQNTYKINEIKNHILNLETKIEIKDTLLINDYTKKYDYIFCNPCFAKDYREYLTVKETGEYNYKFRLLNNQLWRFVYKAINLLSKDGKACIVLPLKTLFKQPDNEIRKELIESGVIEAVIDLPGDIHNNTSAETVLLILSKNNTGVKFVDGKNCLTESRELNVEELYKLYKLDNNIITNEKIAEHNYLFLTNVYFDSTKKEMNNPVLLKSFIEVSRGYQNTSKKVFPTNLNYKIINLADVSNGILNKEELTPLHNTPNLDKFLLRDKDLLIKARGSKFECAIIDIEDNEKIVASGNYLIIRVKDNNLNPYYLKLFLESEIGQKSLFRNQVKTTLLSINSTDVMDTYIDLIDIKKQNKIGSEYINIKNEMIRLNKELKKLESSLSNLLK